MKPRQLKVARIGNSRGVRLPAATLDRYHIGDVVVMEERVEGILLRPHGHTDAKISWEATALEMADAAEDWSEWEAVPDDGLGAMPWDAVSTRHVAERDAAYAPAARRPKQKKRKKR